MLRAESVYLPLAIAVLAGSILVVSVLASSGALSQSERRGVAVYTLNCYSCHEEEQPDLMKPPPKLQRIFSNRYLPDGTTLANDKTVRSVITNGKGTMPAFNGRLSDQQITDLVAYLHRK